VLFPNTSCFIIVVHLTEILFDDHSSLASSATVIADGPRDHEEAE